jgi:hypothetical protein
MARLDRVTARAGLFTRPATAWPSLARCEAFATASRCFTHVRLAATRAADCASPNGPITRTDAGQLADEWIGVKVSGMYGFTTKLTGITFDQAQTRAIESVKGEGFGVLSDIDVQRAMKDKLGVEMPPLLLAVSALALGWILLPFYGAILWAMPPTARPGDASTTRAPPRWRASKNAMSSQVPSPSAAQMQMI